MLKKYYILIPVYNRKDITIEGLNSIQQALRHFLITSDSKIRFEIIIIDDGSTDRTSEELVKYFNGLIILHGTGNLWWSGAINMGITYINENHLDCDGIILWNDDTICDENYFLHLSKYLETDLYKKSILVSKIYWLDDKYRLFNYGLKFNKKNGKSEIIGFNEVDDDRFSNPLEIDWSGGMGTIIPFEIVNLIGLFDDQNFPQYLGDKDFFLRAKKKGIRVFALPELKIWNRKETSGLSLNKPYLKSFVKLLTSNRSQFNLKQNFIFIKKHSFTLYALLKYINTYIILLLSLVNKVTKIKDFLLSIRLIVFNHVITKIPINIIRINLMRLYIKIGKNSNVMPNVIIYNKSLNRNQIQIGDNCVINRDCLLDGRKGKILLGNNVDIARGTWIFTMEHDPHSDYHNEKHGDVILKDYCWIASRVTILPNITLKKGVVVATGAVVTKSFEEMAIIGGIPAKKIGVRTSKLKYNLTHFPFFGY